MTTTTQRPAPRPLRRRTLSELRAGQMSMFAKLVADLKSTGLNPLQVARALGLPTPGKTIVFQGETDTAACSDFMIAEARCGGRTLVESADPVALEMNAVETAALEAFRNSRTSLFQLRGVSVGTNELLLVDLLEPDRPEVRLIDVHFSAAARMHEVAWLMFIRVLMHQELSMSSGLVFLFDPSWREHLLQSFRQKMKKVPPAELSAQKFAFFCRKHREIGQPMGYETVE